MLAGIHQRWQARPASLVVRSPRIVPRCRDIGRHIKSC